jgi:hypothetical protein
VPEREWAELERLRDWRHETVTPTLAAHHQQLRNLRDRMDKVEPVVEQMAAAARDMRTAAASLRQHRSLWATRGGKVWAAALSLVVAVAEVYRAVWG